MSRRAAKRRLHARFIVVTKPQEYLGGWLIVHPGNWMRPFNFKEPPR